MADICGVQAQDTVAEGLSVRVRTAGLTSRSVDEARTHDRSVVRTWAMRGTLHLVATDDVRWMLSLLGPVMIGKSRRRLTELGLTEDVRPRAVAALRTLLESRGPLTRSEIADRLARKGLPVEGQGAYHLIRLAVLEGVVCIGPERDGEGTYDLLDRWVPHACSVDDPLIELARRYLLAYGPAGPSDLAQWSGLSLRDSRAAFEGLAGELIEVSVEGSPAWIPASRSDWLDAPVPHAPVVRLLPAFDTYLLGYRERDLGVPPEHARRVHPGGGIIRPTLMVDGRAAGVWARKKTRRGTVITVNPFEDLPPDVMPGLEEEAAGIGRFLGEEAALSFTPS